MKITGKIEPTAARNLIKSNWTDKTVSVKFIKKNGDERLMKVRLNPDCLTSHVNGSAEQTRRETNRIHNNMVVSEILDDGTYQTRVIPLEKVTEISF